MGWGGWTGVLTTMIKSTQEPLRVVIVRSVGMEDVLKRRGVAPSRDIEKEVFPRVQR